jgi:hypothetical protein
MFTNIITQICYDNSYILTTRGEVGFSSMFGRAMKSSLLCLSDSSSLVSLKAFS